MTFHSALRAAVLAIPLVVACNTSSRADFFDFGPSVSCYDYDPYDRYHLYGKYYPYGRAHCGRRSADRNYVIKPTSASAGAANCVKTNVRNFRNACLT
jgi:hypothetical protein